MEAHAGLPQRTEAAQRDRATVGSEPGRGLDSWVGGPGLAGRRALDWLERCWNRCDAVAHAVGCWRSAEPIGVGVLLAGLGA